MKGLYGVSFYGLQMKQNAELRGYRVTIKSEPHYFCDVNAPCRNSAAAQVFQSGELGFDGYLELKTNCSIVREVSRDFYDVLFSKTAAGQHVLSVYESLSADFLSKLIEHAGVTSLNQYAVGVKNAWRSVSLRLSDGAVESVDVDGTLYPSEFYDKRVVVFANGKQAVWYSLNALSRALVIVHLYRFSLSIGVPLLGSIVQTLVDRWSELSRHFSASELIMLPHRMVGLSLRSTPEFSSAHLHSGEHGMYWAGESGYTSQKDRAGRFSLDRALSLVSHVGYEKHISVEFAV